MLADAQDDGFDCAYGPSIILKDGKYHVFFCSKGWLQHPSGDAIRYTSSTDGQNWAQARVILQATATNGSDLAACDPSLVFYQGFYYLYYSSATTTSHNNHQTVIQVARSAQIQGPYFTYTQRGTWEHTPRDPRILIFPLRLHTSQRTGYGAGQPSVIVRNGELFMWYTDDSVLVDGQPQVRAYMLRSTDPLKWRPDPANGTNLINEASIDVKFDASQAQFVMVRVEKEFTADSYLATAHSTNGLTWTVPQNVFPSSRFPPYTHDAGIAGDETGVLISSPTLTGFGAPYNLTDRNSWAKWNLYSVDIEPDTTVPAH
jgi:hypothetical protein